MKKLVVLGAGAVAAASIGLLSAGVAISQPGAGNEYNVVGEPYQGGADAEEPGREHYFGGSFGSVLPQAQCLVEQKIPGRPNGADAGLQQKAARH